MSALHRKLIRDLWRMKGQCIAIAVLVALAVGTFTGAAWTEHSLMLSRDAYYARYRFGDVFTEVARAPLALGARLRGIDGVDQVEMRLAASGLLTLPHFGAPISARFVGLPRSGIPNLGRVHIRSGRLPDSAISNEVVISEPFANSQHLAPGASFNAVINGRSFPLVVCGVGLSPEHVYEVRPGDMFPDPERFGVLWVDRALLEQALGMTDSFNEVVLRLSRTTNETAVIGQVDRLLRPFGSGGAYGRARHVSARFIADELKQLEATAVFIPAIFLLVAAFLLSIIVGRVVSTEREQIATLKALGFTNFTVAKHYVTMTLCIVLLGEMLGIAIGFGFGKAMMTMYAGYYRFAAFYYAVSAKEIVVSVLAASLAALAATLTAVRRSVKLQPAEAMRPAAPAKFSVSLFERMGASRLLSMAGRMSLRNLSRRPWRAVASCIGISFAVALLVVGMFFGDSMAAVMDNQFRNAERQDLTVSFNHAISFDALYELGRWRGVLQVEPQRIVGAIFRHQQREYRSALYGLEARPELQRVLSTDSKTLQIPREGVMLSDTLAANIDAHLGDTIQLQLLEGRQQTANLTVAAIANEPFGTSAYAALGTVNELLGTGPQINTALLRIDEHRQPEIYRGLMALPTVQAVTSRKAMLASFETMTEQALLAFAGALSLFASAMAAGVVYNAVRISLSERERELATLRVIGLTRAEVSVVLLGELMVLVAMALPLGCLLGYGLAQATAVASSTDLYRIPCIVSAGTYLFAVSTVLVAAVAAAFFVRRRVDRLDLVYVLKVKE